MEQKYINERLDEQITWYSDKSQWNQKWFKILKIIEFTSASLIPFLVAYSDECVYIKYIVGFLGIGIAVVAGLLSLYKFQENWIEYRTTSETLKHQKYLYETSCPPYDNKETSFTKLVQVCEGLISKENSNWAQYIKISKKHQEQVDD